jgi:hypothetical protein
LRNSRTLSIAPMRKQSLTRCSTILAGRVHERRTH